MKTVNDFSNYQILDMANGMKLETWNQVKLLRPDPQIIWTKKNNPDLWHQIDATYERSNLGGGKWNIQNKKMPTTWQVT